MIETKILEAYTRRTPEALRQLGVERATRSELAEYKPDVSWFTRDPGGLHGISHSARGAVLASVDIPVQEIVLNRKLDRSAIFWFFATHDTKRLTDEEDIAHGERSAHWVDALQDRMSPSTLALLKYLNYWHVPEDYHLKGQEMPPELVVAKNCDNAERIRSGDLNKSYLRGLTTRKYLPQLASDLFQATANYKLVTPEKQYDYVLDQAVRLGMLLDR